ncbi:MAG: DUF1553 domain-containing protein [Verrucomicrobiales bacterium]
MRFKKKWPVAALLGCLALHPALQAQPKTVNLPSEQVLFFEKNIRPLLVEHCYDCHGAKSEKGAKGGLYLDTREGLLAGGSSGPAILAGNPDKSLIIQAVRYEDEDLQMPPKGNKLEDEQISLLEEWVRMGAPDPRIAAEGQKGSAIDFGNAREHWAFRPPVKPALPQPRDAEKWAQSPVDAFILAKLQEHKLAPSPLADRRTLIRRATYDLTGLPPTFQEVEAFLNDSSSTPKAFAKVVDRLLDSPRYGERWGRHWLDVARYADTTGDRNNRGDARYPYSWTYRDYVVKAFNDDLPFNQFILEQIAADRLPQSKNKPALAALGFLTVGKRFMNNANDIIDDRIDVVTQGFLGLTVSCARCHDHKFDPIPTRDYYALHGVFNSSLEPEEKPILGKWEETEASRDYLNQLAKVDEEVAELRQRELNRLSNLLHGNIDSYLLGASELKRANDPARATIARKRKLDANLLELWRMNLDQLERSGNPVFEPWFALRSAPPRRWKQKAAAIQDELKEGKLNDVAINPLVANTIATANIRSLEDVAAIYEQLFTDAAKDGLLAENSAVADEDEPTNGLQDSSSYLEQIRDIARLDAKALQLDDRQIRRLLGNQHQNRENQIRSKKVALHISHPGSPPRAMALVDAPSPRNSRVLIRGERGNMGPETPRQFLEILSEGDRKPFQNGSGRLELAHAIASPQNPLTSRVIVNRVWQKHFGAGIVRTQSDFGLRTEPPTHPELFDYLSVWFVENGWSLKKLHRLIMLSSVYQQSSLPQTELSKIDPENKYLWRMNIQRLEFEAIRDTLVFLGGKTDFTMGGSPVPLNQFASNSRRTLYFTVDRLALPESFRIFDFANPDMSSGQRYLTTVPQQALFFMNSQLVAEQARNLMARRELKSARSDDEKLHILFRLVFQRTPLDAELNLARTFLGARKDVAPATQPTLDEPGNPRLGNRRARQRQAGAADNRKAVKPLTPWERYAQTLLQSNELVFVN